MTSIRHNSQSAVPPAPSPDDDYLDAARAAILAVGWSRTTLTDIAKRAGVSRMTLYRRWPDMQAMLADLMTREWSRVVGGATRAGHGPQPAGDAVDRIRDGVVAAVRALRADELLRRIVDVDPELLLPYLLARRGRSQDAILEVVTERVAEGQRRGIVRPGDPATVARGLVLACHGFVLSAQTMVDDAVTPDALDEELAEILNRALAP